MWGYRLKQLVWFNRSACLYCIKKLIGDNLLKEALAPYNRRFYLL